MPFPSTAVLALQEWSELDDGRLERACRQAGVPFDAERGAAHAIDCLVSRHVWILRCST